MSVYVIATLTAKDGKRDDLLKLFTEKLLPVVEKEKGTVTYNIFKHKDANKVVFYEVYADKGSLKEHGDNLAKNMGALAPLLNGKPDIQQLEYVKGKSASSSSSSSSSSASGTVAIGTKLPNVKLMTTGANGMPTPISSADFFKGKRVVLFAVPGAFTPGCSIQLPDFQAAAKEICSKGVDAVACLATNDAFVMNAWKNKHQTNNITMLSDGNGEFTSKIGMTMDASKMGLGSRSMRYAMVVKDGVVEQFLLDADAKVNNSAASCVLAKL